MCGRRVSPTRARHPNCHEAVAEEETTDFDPGTILSVQRKGYVLHDRLLRAAVVTVAKAPEEAETPIEETE